MEAFEEYVLFTPDMLMEIFCDEDMAKGMAGNFIEINYHSGDKSVLNELIAAYKAKNYKDLTRLAHSLKGSARGTGAQRMEQICSKLQNAADEKKGPINLETINKYLSLLLRVLMPSYLEVCKYADMPPTGYTFDQELLDTLGLKLEDVEMKLVPEGATVPSEISKPNEPLEEKSNKIEDQQEIDKQMELPEEVCRSAGLPQIPGSQDVVQATKRSGSQLSFQQPESKKDIQFAHMKEPNPSPAPKAPGTPPPEENLADEGDQNVFYPGTGTLPNNQASSKPHTANHIPRPEVAELKIPKHTSTHKIIEEEESKSAENIKSAVIGSNIGSIPMATFSKEVDNINFFELAENIRKSYQQKRGRPEANVRYTCTLPKQSNELLAQITSPLMFTNKKEGEDDDYPFDQGYKCTLI